MLNTFFPPLFKAGCSFSIKFYFYFIYIFKNCIFLDIFSFLFLDIFDDVFLSRGGLAIVFLFFF